MEFKSFAKFRSSVQQLPAFQSIHPKDRRGFLTDAYKLAKAKYQKEQWMETAGQHAKSVRASAIRTHYRVAHHIFNALKDIEKAKKAAAPTDPKLMRQLQFLEAYDILRAGFDDLGFGIGMLIASIHPHHRTDLEKRFRAAYPHKFLSKVEERYWEIPARRSRFDYLLAREVSSRLDTCRTSSGRPIRPVDRYRIISRVFLAALGQTYIEKTVETALLRTPKS
jgi:hypothetical protein